MMEGHVLFGCIIMSIFEHWIITWCEEPVGVTSGVARIFQHGGQCEGAKRPRGVGDGVGGGVPR